MMINYIIKIYNMITKRYNFNIWKKAISIQNENKEQFYAP